MANASMNTGPDDFSASVGEAQASVTGLATVVTQVLESNREISRRIARLEQQNSRWLPSTTSTITRQDAILSPSLAESDTVEDIESILTVRGPVTDAQNISICDPRRLFEYSFDQDLNTSRPYRRALQKYEELSTTSSEIHTMGWSCLSGISLAEVSHISVINLLFCPQDLWNGHHYSSISVDRDSFVHTENINSSGLEATQPAPTFHGRLKTGVPVHASQSGQSPSIIKKDNVAPVVVRNIALFGIFLLQATM